MAGESDGHTKYKTAHSAHSIRQPWRQCDCSMVAALLTRMEVSLSPETKISARALLKAMAEMRSSTTLSNTLNTSILRELWPVSAVLVRSEKASKKS